MKRVMKRDIQITTETLSTAACTSFIEADAAGGHVIFIGTVRNKTQDKTVVKLEFESYTPMAIKEINKICDSIAAKWPEIIAVSLHHRLGPLHIGDIPVIIAVSSPHRKKAFEACEYAIDTLKQTVPIWKKEIFDDGEVWVAAHP